MIYLDNAATTYPKPEEVYKALDYANRNAFNTGRGSYKIARELTKIIDDTREQILKLNNISNGNVIFTPSSTSALNDIVFGINVKEGDNIYISPFEHNSIVRPLVRLKKIKKINIIQLPFDRKTWNLDENKLKNMFALNRPTAIFITHVNNVTGYIVPYDKIFSEGKSYNSINVLDCSQSYGILPIKNVDDVSYMVFAGHKSLYASFGIAGIIKLKDDILIKSIFGGTGSDTMNPEMSDVIPDGYEAGSPNIVAIFGLNTSLKWLNSVDINSHEKELTMYFIEQLKKIRKCRIFIPDDYENKIFGVVSFAIDGYSSDEVGDILDSEFDIYVRTGFHCGPLIHDFIGSMNYNGTVRASFNYFNTKDDIDNLISALKTL